jgi:hypothetical protein
MQVDNDRRESTPIIRDSRTTEIKQEETATKADIISWHRYGVCPHSQASVNGKKNDLDKKKRKSSPEK